MRPDPRMHRDGERCRSERREPIPHAVKEIPGFVRHVNRPSVVSIDPYFRPPDSGHTRRRHPDRHWGGMSICSGCTSTFDYGTVGFSAMPSRKNCAVVLAEKDASFR